MSILSSKQKLIDALSLAGIETVALHTASIQERGVYCFYDGCARTGIGDVTRSFLVIAAGFDGMEALEAQMDSIEAALFEASLTDTFLSHEATQRLFVSDEGLFLYQSKVTIRDIES